ncbi:hypothetical protein ZWY2020_006439, partial [Hordeum vulgare]
NPIQLKLETRTRASNLYATNCMLVDGTGLSYVDERSGDLRAKARGPQGAHKPCSRGQGACGYQAFLRKMCESENGDEEIHEVIHKGSLDEKHDCNYFTINPITENHAKNMQNPKLGDASFAMTTTYCNNHDWGDDLSYVLENLFKPPDEYDICNNIESGIGETLHAFFVEGARCLCLDVVTFVHQGMKYFRVSAKVCVIEQKLASLNQIAPVIDARLLPLELASVFPL